MREPRHTSRFERGSLGFLRLEWWYTCDQALCSVSERLGLGNERFVWSDVWTVNCNQTDRGAEKRGGHLGNYVAGIGFQYRNYHLGTYRRLEDAVEVRKKTEQLIWNEGDAFYHKWKERADADATWAKEHPIRFCISKDEERGYIVSFVPEL